MATKWILICFKKRSPLKAKKKKEEKMKKKEKKL
jgi:hypothetical protein